MGRAPCCDKANVKKGPWSPEEDAKLKSYIEQHGTGGNWIALPQKIGLKRCGKSCRLRWLNYLRPNLRHGGFSEEEDNIICSLYVSIGSRWSVIAAQLPGRTDNDIKNYWNTRLKKKLLGIKHRKDQQQLQQQARSNNDRGNNSVVYKQEISNIINRGSDGGGGDCDDSFLSLLVHQNSTQQHPYYWPQQIMMPVMQPLSSSHFSHPNQQLLEPCFNGQDSIKKLLIKLGGRFSDDDCLYYNPTLDGFDNNNNRQFSSSHGTSSLSTQKIYDHQEQVHVGSYSACSEVQFAQNNNHQYSAQGDIHGFDLVHGQGSFSEAIEEIVSTNFPQGLNGLEFFYGDEDMMVSDKIIIGSTSTTSCSQGPNNNWGETSSTPIYHPPLVDSSKYQGQGVREETTQECALQEFSYPGEQ